MFRKLLLGLIVFLGLFSQLLAQEQPWNNQRYVWIPAQDSFLLDSLTILPYSLQVFKPVGGRYDSTFYQLDQQTFRWLKPSSADSILVYYRVLPYDFSSTYSLLDTAKLEKTPEGLLVGTYNPYAREGGLLDGQRLNYSGSFSRGLSFGNRQDLVLNSSFNLQLGGELGDGIKVTAAITDENLPIQPEGNTRQLRDFDRIFIRLEKNQTQLTAGDYELRSPQSYFMQYFKKLEGASFSTSLTDDQGGRWSNNASVAIARGQFRRQQITAVEGNQGPYKLQGNNGERFIIILAGTEKILLDGQALQRGRDADYVIDYNQGEVTFTARRLITKDSRITVEFEYADQRYLRSLYAAGSQYQRDRWQAYVNIYSQQDSKTATGDLQLSDEEQQRLREAGDQLSDAFVSTITSLDAPDSQRATYAQVDTTINCNGEIINYTFLRFSPEGLLVASFAFVGEGQGDYVLDASLTANERAYRWVAPDENCQPQGSYAPIRRLAAPQLQRLITAGGQYETGKNSSLRAELAFSQEDLNRFSNLDAADDQGIATRFDWTQHWQLSADTSKWLLETSLSHEWVQANFRAINPYRSPEFLRDWNLADINGIGSTNTAEEQLGGAGLALLYPKRGRLEYRWSTFVRDSLYNGQQHSTAFQWEEKGWNINAKSSWLQSSSPTQNGRFIRPSLILEKKIMRWNNWKIRVEAQEERSERRQANDAQLAASSFLFQRYAATIASPEEEKWQWQASFRSRFDYQPNGANFSATALAQEGETTGRWRLGKQFNASANLTYRELQIINDGLTTLEPAQTLLGRIDATVNALKGGLRSNTTYEIGAGQEPLVEFVYLFVGAGQGQYIWLDSLYNNDGKIQPNEMEIAPFPDIADHIRVSIFTDEFIRTDNVVLNQSLQIDPSRWWSKSEKKWQQFANRFSWQSSLSINRKVRDFQGVQTWNPFQLSLPDSALVAVSANQRHILFFNRRSTKYDFQLEYNVQPRRQVPTTGFESRLQRNNILRFRWNVTDASTFRMEMAKSERESDSEFFNNKDYQLSGYLLQPAISYQPGQDYRITFTYLQQEEENQLENTGDKLRRNEFQLEGNYQQFLRLNARYVNLKLEGDPRSPVGFVLLNGLQPGRNWIWNASLTRQLGRYLQMTLTYEGRQTGEAQTVHVGRAQVTAIF